MDSPGEILRLCRLCLVKDQVNIPIFEEEGDSREIFLKISSCLPVKVSREDRLPKKICDGCSEKLNSFYEFWSSSANAEKTLLSWVGEEDVEEKEEPAVSKSLAASATLVKEESEPVDEAQAESIEESTKDEADEAPPAKRARRSAAVKAQINLAPDSEDDDLDMGEPLTKTEEESAESDGEDKDPSYTDMPGTSADDEQAGPSGMGKDGVEAPKIQFLCTECGKKFFKRKSFTLHVNRHNRRKLGIKFACDTCGNSFLSKLNLVNHKRKVHLNDYRYCCDQCGKRYVCNGELNQHIKTAHTKSKSKFQCEFPGCQLSFNRKPTLRFHVKSKHSGVIYKCSSCPSEFQHPYRLREHVRKHHEKPRPVFQCDFCSVKLATKMSLRQHIRVHTGEKPFACQHCNRLFRTNPQLKAHQVVHTKEKPFGCWLCPKKFTQRGSVTVHVRKCHPQD